MVFLFSFLHHQKLQVNRLHVRMSQKDQRTTEFTRQSKDTVHSSKVLTAGITAAAKNQLFKTRTPIR